MKIKTAALAFAITLAAPPWCMLHADGPEPITHMDIPDLWGWATITPLLKGAPHQNVPEGFVPDPVSIRPRSNE